MTERFGHLITEENAKWWTLAAMCFALFMIMLDNTVMNVALPSIQSDLGMPRSRRWSGSSTATASPSPCCSRPAAGSATSSAAAGCS